MKEKGKPINIRLSAELTESLKEMAATERRTLTNMITVFVEDGINRAKAQTNRGIEQ